MMGTGMKNERLMKMLNYTQSDLTDNRQGRLSDRQITLNMRRTWLGVIVLVVAGIGAGVFMTYAAGPQPRAINIALGGLVALGGVALAVVTYITARRTLNAGEVHSVTGEAAIEYRSEMRAGTYILIVDEREFLINEPMSKAFTEGEQYTIYHLPTERRPISVEQH